jgi:glucose/arabinose dehydrogenase
MPTAAAAALAFALASTISSVPASAESGIVRVDAASYRVETVTSGLEKPWSIAFLPDGRRLVTELPGRLRIIDADGALRPRPVTGVPPVYGAGQSGLMEVAVDPDFVDTGLIFLTFAHGTRDANNTRLVSARLVGEALTDVRILFSATPKAGSSHYGGRIAFLSDKTLALTLGDGFDRREDAQNPANTLGKIVRINRDGSVPADNPFVGKSGVPPEIYSLGHRNVQGIALDRADGSLLVSEHGPRGGDELNQVVAGKNYGWPVVSGGIDYSYARVTPFTSLPGYEAALLEWTPSIAPSGLAIYDGALFPGWRGDLLVPALVERGIRRIKRENGRIVGQELMLAELNERIRDVRMAADGSLTILTDGARSRLLRVTPTK